MHHNWIEMEYYRLQIVEQWDDGPYKEATLAAIRSSLATRLWNPRVTSSQQESAVSALRILQRVEFAKASRIKGEQTNIAA